MNRLVSILIPAFNAGEWLADTLRSAVAQTWTAKEIIVVDDGSEDQTLAIARQFARDGVRIFTQKNQGAAAARNKALSLSQGDYIQWLDADDLLAPEKIALQMQTLREVGEEKILLSAEWGRFMYRPYRAHFTPTELWCDLSPVEWLLRKMGQNLYMQTATWLVSRELSNAAGPWDTRLLGDDDGEYFCRILLASRGVRFVRGARVYYRKIGSTGLSYVGRSNRKVEAHWCSMKSHLSYLRSLEDSDRVREACIKYLQTSLIYFYPERPDIVHEAEEMARDMSGRLEVPRLSWKYSWIQILGGLALAKRVQLRLRKFRWALQARLDQLMYRLEAKEFITNSSRS